jgi:competence protein ComEC
MDNMDRRNTKTALVAIAAIVAVVLVAFVLLRPQPAPPEPAPPAQTGTEALDMSVSVIDVGQGDSTLVVSEGQAMLVDAGGINSGDEVSAYLQSQGVDVIDYLVTTHPDSDHIGGVKEVLEDFDVKHDIIAPARSSDTATYRGFLDAVGREPGGVALVTPAVGSSFHLGDATVEVLSNGDGAANTNDASIVLKVTCADRSALLTGDISASVEQRLVDEGLSLGSDVLKVAHHGSHTASGASFLRAVSPQYAVISVGANNRYGHPRAEALERLSATGAVLYRTDVDGTVVFIFSDGDIAAKAA